MALYAMWVAWEVASAKFVIRTREKENEVISYKYIFVLLTFLIHYVNNEKTKNNDDTVHTTPRCPFTRIIEDIFKMKNKTEAGTSSNEKAKLFLNSIADVRTDDKDSNRSVQDALVDDIIASIKRIKNNLYNKTSDDGENKLNEAIILNVPETLEKTERRNDEISISGIKSGIEDKIDTRLNNSLVKNKQTNENRPAITKPTYVEILTIEPNNTSNNLTTSHNIIEVLKHLMPMFNSTLTKELHNLTIIERNHHKNHSFSATKNVSTIVVTYCDHENFTKGNVTFENVDTDIKIQKNNTDDNDYLESEEEYDYEEFRPEVNLTKTEKKDIMEAAEYGMQKMHELYAVMEPKLYSMGLWLDDSNPARYVAAFNAPSEDAAKFYRYGYASLQAAAKLKQLTSRDGLESRTEEAQFPAASALRQSPLLQHCPLRGTPKCPPASKRYRTHDGTCNNLNRPRWGSTMTPVQRFLAPSYSDGIQAPRRSVFGSPLPSAREISSMVHEDQHVETPGITHLLMQWGQFLDHDHPECMPIAVPQSDPFYGPKGVRCLDFVRSSPAPRDDCALGWREQMNQVSAYIDGSPLYASSARQSDKLRLFRNGMLQYGKVQNRRPLLPPERRDELCRGGAVSSDCFKSGDARVNEHPGLVAAHIVWLRQHNRMAQELAHLNPHWSDEKVYQETRKIVGAMIQHITYREFLPIVLGQEVMRLFDLEPQKKGYYTGYSPKINPSPASSFGSAAFRFGHSLVQPSMVRFDRFHRPMKNNVSLHDELTNPSNIWSMGAVDRLLLGMVNQPIQKRDEFITEELTNHLFQTPSYENGGFESSLTPAQLQQIRRISFAQILCRTLDTIDSIQPFVFLSAENIDNDRISCLNGLLNNFDLSPWTDVNSSNDISKSDDISTQAPNETKTTTTKKPTTKKPQKLAANKVGQKKPAPANTYDDTYRRPNKPYYYNRQNDKNENYNLRQNRPNLNDETFSSARSNEQTMTTTKSEATIDKNDVTDNNKPTTENLYKLVTFGYVGTYKGDMANFKETKTDPTHQTIKHDFISKDFSTYEDEKVDKAEKQEFTKLSTFFHYDTATKPYNNVRPTRRNDDDLVPDYTKTNSKYYFVRNVLRKYPDDNSTVTDKTDDATEIKDILKENYNGPGQPLPVTIEERASGDKLALLEEAEAKSANPEPSKLRLKITKPSSPAKTPTVAFQVMPSENNPSQWATYDEKDLPEGLPHRMPPIKTDPYALKEIPRPFNFANLRKRIPGRTRN
ncbi:hypothetical protein MSG28_003849 [Choristoneura fumiferana]|uniref:Uncharacterized protein n=1 Tax=Choristoneura fumiferana TaxID=7141 RepID=A0ACC0KH32_CHOFU|nr:hypothetical protein MSG28_003849 [Choristoneura fumiferana]